MSDDAIRWQRVGALFDRALQAPPAERLALIHASGEPPDIQDEVIELLTSHDANGAFLEPPALLSPGSVVGAYCIDRVLGRGGMGVVYLATDTRLHRRAALKSLPPHLFQDDNMRARLRHEARAAAALSHPSIATIYSLEELGDHVFIASEYLEGQTLRDVMRGAPMDQPRVLDIARAIASALTAAHERGIVHRDLKPENVMITAGGVKIVDFGLAQFDVAAQDLASVGRMTDIGTVAGTPPYMSPEQLLGQPTDGRTDQFAFGILLYEMLTGAHPFSSDLLPMTIAKTLASNPERGDVPERLWVIIDRALKKDAAARYASMRDMLNALTEAGTSTPASGATGTASTDSTAGTESASGTSGTVRTDESVPVRTDRAVWWERHQLIVALAYWLMVWPTWRVHGWAGQYGVLTFLAVIAVVVIGANTRLHLWFSARNYPEQLATRPAVIRLLVRVADIALSVQMIAIGLTIANEHTGWAALFVSFGLGALLACLVIEPATERAAFGRR